MLYLLDANVLIDANRDYYPVTRFPEFWDWLAEMGKLGFVKVPMEIYEEVVPSTPMQRDPLVDWLKANRDAIVLDEQVNPEIVAYVVEQGYANDLTDEETEEIGRDPFLIAYALTDTSDRTIVTTEKSRPSRRRANRHIPDVSQGLGVTCIDTFHLIEHLDFRTDWRARR